MIVAVKYPSAVLSASPGYNTIPIYFLLLGVSCRNFALEPVILEHPVRVDIQLYRARGGTFERGERGRLQGRSHGERG